MTTAASLRARDALFSPSAAMTCEGKKAERCSDRIDQHHTSHHACHLFCTSFSHNRCKQIAFLWPVSIARDLTGFPIKIYHETPREIPLQ